MIVYNRRENRLRDILSLLKKEGEVLLYINIVFILVYNSFYRENAGFIILFFLLLLLIRIFRKRNRLINKLTFIDEQSVFRIEYLDIIKNKALNISYNELNFIYGNKIYARFISRKTLEIFKKDLYIAELREKDNFGWSNDTIKTIYEKLKTIKNERSDQA